MSQAKNIYNNPLAERYAGEAMNHLFSDDVRFTTWRKLWIALAEAQQELGVDISNAQIRQMKSTVDNINYVKVKKYEKKFRHDVMAHIHAYGDLAPLAKPIIHLGATSAFVVDNTDIIQIVEGLHIIKRDLINILINLKKIITKYKSLPTLGYTHYQPAQLTTVGKRASLWAHSLIMDIEELDFVLDTIKMRGAKGTTGTSASYKDLFKGNFKSTKILEQKIAKKMGFKDVYPVTGQTYDRKIDTRVLNVLAQIAQSTHKITNDIRLLAGLKQLEEPFEKTQVGSSAMAYKRNPMRSERAASLAKFVMSIAQSGNMVASTQWFERTLDDSANKRLSISQAFLASDGMLVLLHNITDGMVVYPNVINRYVQEELPFMLTEHILMKSVEQGGDRQLLHEVIRQHAMKAANEVKMKGKRNDLLSRLAQDERIPFTLTALEKLCSANLFTGFAKEQAEQFVQQVINPLLRKNKKLIGLSYKITV